MKKTLMAVIGILAVGMMISPVIADERQARAKETEKLKQDMSKWCQEVETKVDEFWRVIINEIKKNHIDHPCYHNSP